MNKELFETLPYPNGMALTWPNEQSGQLRKLLMNFLDATLSKSSIKPSELETVQAYFKYYIHAPLWEHPDFDEQSKTQLAQLRTKIKEAKTLEQLKAWIDDCLDIGIDPV
jgi:hypothetical protein